ncbi:type II toxin-antitoxin system PemK/MazF family toxin [Phycicoccus jejuensis]|uniref:type II toxin-antitoxin system PemK/MazF family toxin n=1 Tax=Phycicoccus jejuensis TaxID=367299 RepID=UPI001FE1A4F5|nr:type II toxin-antitoxin system PemK/MazF family toxin [Phycicoccus jejuensis]
MYGATLPNIGAEKYFLVVSNNQRNRALRTALVVRLTTSRKPSLPSIVALGHGERFVGWVVCDDIMELYEDEVSRDLGALSGPMMTSVSRGLKAALDLP